jgi:hypothetical protein
MQENCWFAVAPPGTVSAVQSISNSNFGPLVAYLVPGATVLFGLSRLSPQLHVWFAATPPDSPTIGGFLYVTVASLAAGMSVNAVRWAIVDHIHAWTGLPMPKLDFSKLGPNVEAYTLLIEIHYHHYQHFANMFVATAIAYSCYRISLGGITPIGRLDAGFLVLEAIFFATSRDTLRKYYQRGQQLLAPDGCHRLSASSSSRR